MAQLIAAAGVPRKLCLCLPGSPIGQELRGGLIITFVSIKMCVHQK